MSFDIVVRRDDELPEIQKTVYLNGAPVDLTGSTATFTVFGIDGTEFFDNPAETDDEGHVTYQFTDADFVEIDGQYAFAQFHIVVTATGDELTVPNNRPLSMFITNTSSFEYSYTGDPAARPIDRVRFLLGDTDMNKALFTDAEIAFLLTEYSNPYAAAAEAALSYSARYTDLRDKTVGPLSIRYSAVAEQWGRLANSLRQRASRRTGAVAITTQSSKGHIFVIGQNDFPESNLQPWNNVQHLDEPSC